MKLLRNIDEETDRLGKIVDNLLDLSQIDAGRLRLDKQPTDVSRLAREVVDYIQESFEDVGTKFAAEALKIHYGVAEKRNIRGSATVDEEKTLKDEGVEFFKIPVVKKTDEEKEN